MAEKPYASDIDQITLENDNFRKVLFTTKISQLVVMSVPAGGEIGEETHDGIDQVLKLVAGEAEVTLDGKKSTAGAGSIVVVPSGTKHNFVTKGDEPMKIYSIYTPPDHKDGTIHRTKEDADNDPNEQH